MNNISNKNIKKISIRNIIYILTGVVLVIAVTLIIVYTKINNVKADYSSIFIDTDSDKYVQPIIINSKGQQINISDATKSDSNIYGYIDIKDTSVNAFVERNDSASTNLYTTSSNTKKFSERNVVVYVNENEYPDILNYTNTEYLLQHTEVSVSSLESDMQYKIFASALWENTDIMTKYDFTSYKGFTQYISEVKASGIYYDEAVSMDSKSQIITFSVPISDDKRLLILAVRIA